MDGLVVGTDILYPTPDENSEALDSHLKFTESGDTSGWLVTSGSNNEYYYDGDALCNAATTSSGEEACLQTIVESDSSETIKFHWKVSSEANHDYLQFYINDTLKDQISGEVDWQQKSYAVSSGIHTLKWVYVKDGSNESGKDCGWVDFVHWSGPSPQQNPSEWQNIEYKHDLAGRRSEKKVDGFSTRYLYDGDHVIVEYDGNNNLLRKYIYGPGIDQPVCMIEEAESQTYYYHYDALGSVVALSDSAGDTVQTYEYSVFGQVAVEDINHPNPYMFAGRRFDIEIGLYYNRARYYNPFTGRLMQTDPIGYEDGMNLYRYCRNNPIGLRDPYGLTCYCDTCDPCDTEDSNDSTSPIDSYFRASSNNHTWWDTDTDIPPLSFVSEWPATQAAGEAVSWALQQVGNMDYSYGGEIDHFGKNSWKCNKFVFDAYTKGAGVKFPTYKRSLMMKIRGIPAWPVVANDLADPRAKQNSDISNIKNYPIVTGELKVGDIISFPSEEGSGHTSIYIGSGRIIQASGDGGVTITKIRDTPNWEKMVVRRYNPWL